MATSGFGQREARRKKLVTGIVVMGLAMTAVAVSIAYWASSSRKEQPVAAPPSLPKDVHQQSSGYTFTRNDEGRRIFTVHAARTVAFKQGGTTVLEDVVVELFGKSGTRHDIMRTQRCDYNGESGDLFSSGPVQIELNADSPESPDGGLHGKQPVYLETSKVSSEQQGALVVTDQPVRFRLGPASGTAQGMTYATKGGWLELKSHVVMDLRPAEGEDSQPIHLVASRLRYDKLNASVGLTGPVDITQGTQRLVADRGMVFLDARNRMTRAELEGAAKAYDDALGRKLGLGAEYMQGEFNPVTGLLTRFVAERDVKGVSKSASNIADLSANRLEVNLAGNPPRAQTADLAGNVELTVDSVPAAHGQIAAVSAPGETTPIVTQAAKSDAPREKKTLSASEIKLAFRPDGHSLREADTVGPGKLVVLPADPKVGERVITAGQFLMSFDEQSRIESLRGQAPTDILFKLPANAPPGSVAQESTADQLAAAFDPATQTLRDVEQSGNFQFHDGDRQASADQAHYAASGQTLVLTGRPEVWDSRSRVRSERLKFDLRSDVAEGTGKVQATQLQSGVLAGNAPAENALPLQPTNILADHMVADRRSQVIHYDGHVRAWHGQDVVESSALDVYREERRVSSGFRVLTSHLQPASLTTTGSAPGTPARRETRPVTVLADRLEYFDQGRKARYRGHVKMRTEDTELDADSVDVYFSNPESSPDGPEIERSIADGHVRVVQPGRHAKGEHGEYFAGPGKIVLTGGPPELQDAEKGFVSGRRLTFFIHDDRLFVDGGDQSPSISKHRVAQ